MMSDAKGDTGTKILAECRAHFNGVLFHLAINDAVCTLEEIKKLENLYEEGSNAVEDEALTQDRDRILKKIGMAEYDPNFHNLWIKGFVHTKKSITAIVEHLPITSKETPS